MRVGLVKNWQDFVMTLGLAVPVALSPNNVFADYGYQSVNEVALDISPKCEWVTSNSGTGKVDVPSGICDVRNAIVTEPWIRIVGTGCHGTNNEMVYYMSYSYEENDTDTERTGKIIISGAEVCTITQAARGMVWITVETVGCGRVDGAGSSHLAYPLGSEVTLTAVADDGYEFLGWNVSFSCSGYGSKQNPITLTAYSCYVTVRFGPLTPEFTKVEPTVVGDAGATVTGDAETGFVIKPSEGKTAVEVTIPQGVDAAKVTVEVSPKVVSVKPNGAKVKVVSGDADITEFLNVPTADGSGVVDLTKATVKEEIVKEAMDVEKGAEIKLNASNPSLTTPNTRKGLFYQFREGETLGGMKNGDSKVGDGQPWSPEIKVKGSNSAFYSIGVGKGE